MEMINGLPRVAIAVEYGPVSRLMDSKLLSQGLGDLKKLPEQWMILGRDMINRGDMSLRNNEKVDRRHRLYVLECHDKVILVYNFCRHRVLRDLAKDA